MYVLVSMYNVFLVPSRLRSYLKVISLQRDELEKLKNELESKALHSQGLIAELEKQIGEQVVL